MKKIIRLQDAVLNTNGKGLWSRVKKPVTVKSLKIGYLDDESNYGELRAYFPNRSWSTSEDGLIYTDPLFLKELRKLLVDQLGFTRAQALDVNYSEQGMQGDDYVSLDFGPKFLKGWNA